MDRIETPFPPRLFRRLDALAGLEIRALVNIFETFNKQYEQARAERNGRE